MKLAAMEALYNGGTDQSLTAVAWVNPFQQSDYQNEAEAPLRLAIPNGLSILATRSLHGFVPGVNDLLKGYTREDGTVELSAKEKMERGRLAIQTLADYRKAKAEGADEATLSSLLSTLNTNMPYFGYGFIKDESELVPYIPVNFWAFRVMVGLGTLFILFFAYLLFLSWRQKKTLSPVRSAGTLNSSTGGVGGGSSYPQWLLWLSIALLPCAYICSESGWLVAEFGRQPWTIQDMLPVSASVSDIGSTAVATTFWIFLVLFTALLAVEINIMLKQIKKGPAL